MLKTRAIRNKPFICIVHTTRQRLYPQRAITIAMTQQVKPVFHVAIAAAALVGFLTSHLWVGVVVLAIYVVAFMLL